MKCDIKDSNKDNNNKQKTITTTIDTLDDRWLKQKTLSPHLPLPQPPLGAGAARLRAANKDYQ